MQEHHRLVEIILSFECLQGFERDQRRDELEHYSTEDLQALVQVYENSYE